MTSDEIRRKLKEHEDRLKKIESFIFSEKSMKVGKSKKKYDGLAGGIRMIVDDKFLDKPKSLKEILEELKRLGYHYSNTSLNKAVSKDFMKKRLNYN